MSVIPDDLRYLPAVHVALATPRSHCAGTGGHHAGKRVSAFHYEDDHRVIGEQCPVCDTPAPGSSALRIGTCACSCSLTTGSLPRRWPPGLSARFFAPA